MNLTTTLRKIAVLSTLAATLACSPSLTAQEWSASQKAVWKVVQAYADLGAARDIEGFLAYFHEDYLGWHNRAFLPSTKAEARKWAEHEFPTTKVLLHTEKPVGIKIVGDVAFVHYYYESTIKDSEGKQKMQRGRRTDILKKEGEKWLLIGDHGGPEYTEKE